MSGDLECRVECTSVQKNNLIPGEVLDRFFLLADPRSFHKTIKQRNHGDFFDPTRLGKGRIDNSYAAITRETRTSCTVRRKRGFSTVQQVGRKRSNPKQGDSIPRAAFGRLGMYATGQFYSMFAMRSSWSWILWNGQGRDCWSATKAGLQLVTEYAPT